MTTASSSENSLAERKYCFRTARAGMTHVFFAAARAAKVTLIFLGSVLLSCVAATILSGLCLTLILATSRDSGTAGAFFLYYCFFSFGIGSPAFFLAGVPLLHFFPGLKHAHPYSAGIAGAAITASSMLILRLMHHSSVPFSSWDTIAVLVAFPSLWAGIASCVYQRTKQLATEAI
ncbi:hypothetical protein [Xanthomonas campestris]|uniref:hypothetical protein n=1 Tax=Xanthomonas campestris TaxID=339 RepID=UPI0012907012|nr:hypothetical protein [Xanthomonas campestris]